MCQVSSSSASTASDSSDDCSFDRSAGTIAQIFRIEKLAAYSAGLAGSNSLPMTRYLR
jgi:hypothetical protein